MRSAVLFALAAMSAFALMAATSLSLGAGNEAGAAASSAAAQPSAISGLNIDDLPANGQCRLWYDALPSASQPAAMNCEHAMWLARRWGGRVIQADQSGAREIAAFQGRNDFTGVPLSALPHPGYCKAWIDGLPPDMQPAESDCREAKRIANEQHGRVIYMPL
ncbi:MAG TPA: hypothetical protein VG841_08540 [Caulobacterales bacterium]|nr:hypothetical protein [Caulobacterales bacterium]